jgi:hypothetical protein
LLLLLLALVRAPGCYESNEKMNLVADPSILEMVKWAASREGKQAGRHAGRPKKNYLVQFRSLVHLRNIQIALKVMFSVYLLFSLAPRSRCVLLSACIWCLCVVQKICSSRTSLEFVCLLLQ